MVVIVDYGMGNIGSVLNALMAIGTPAVVSQDAEDILQAEKLLLPGVGAFGDGMESLRRLGLVSVLEEAVMRKRTPILGICLGMQLFADSSSEFGENKGLGWIPGRVERIRPSDGTLKIPHVGWNSVAWRSRSPLMEGITQDPTFYFVHSYQFHATDNADVVGVCDYGGEIAAVVQRDNIFGVQFHPEKSQSDGLAILKNFIRLQCNA
ncbi:MAG: imidazole glycerol phosphate synthase subunit HisH [Deltaproteobacteria bacterium]|nr:imidazole glycerol phosphate synthase subunit HisH [Deltaproteobacteria bacterium]